MPGECDGCLYRGFSELKRTFTVPMEINYVRSKQVNFPCMCVFSRDLTHILKLDAIHSTNIWIFRRSYAVLENCIFIDEILMSERKN